MDGFIRKYVLCPECDNPETELMISTKKGTIHQGCKACGNYCSLESNHKLNAYILKNPPSVYFSYIILNFISCLYQIKCVQLFFFVFSLQTNCKL